MSFQSTQPELDLLVSPLAGLLATEGVARWHKAHVDLFSRRLVPEMSYREFCWNTDNGKGPLTMATDLVVDGAFAVENFLRFGKLLTQVQEQSSRSSRQPVRLNVVDYGCGQGVASLALLNHLKVRHLDIDMHLVEPAEVALYAAEKYVAALASCSNGRVRIHGHGCSLDAVSESVLYKPGRATVHLFSGVLDMAGSGRFNLSRLAKKIRNTPGLHLFMATGTDCTATRKGFIRLHSYFSEARILLSNSKISTGVPGSFSLVDCRGKPMSEGSVTGRAMALLFSNTSAASLS